MIRLSGLIGVLLFSQWTFAQEGYTDQNAMTAKLRELERNQKNFVEVAELVKTESGKPVFRVTLSSGPAENKPAVVIVGGVSGSHPFGTELVLSLLEKFTESDSLLNSLNEVSYYVFPDMSPDAREQYFSSLKYEREGNSTKTDDDRDGRMNEDPFEDLNNDGQITWIRVEDETGDWIADETDPRALKKVDKSKGEKGNWAIYSEGRDNDGDGDLNEDGPGGVAFNKNFTYQYPWFKPGAGEFQVSELENRAFLDFLYERTNVFLVLSFGPSDNLYAPMKYNASQARKRVVASMLQEDVKHNELVSKLYQELTGNKGKSATGHPGDFMQWAYFHFGRFSYGTPAWKMPDMKKKSEKSLSKQAGQLRWLDSLQINGFTEWTSVEHPDFPGKKVEVGGIHPFVTSNPPASMLDDIAESHLQFVAEMASRHPKVQAENIRVESVGKNVFRVSVDIFNSGELPAMTEMGERVKWVLKPKISLKLGSGMNLLSGQKVTLLDQLKAGEKSSLTWLIQGKGQLGIIAGAPQMGSVNINVELK